MIRATCVFVFLVTSLSISLRAQGPIVIDENARVILHGNVHPWARLQYDVGRTDPNLRIQRMTLLLVPSRPQQRNWRRAQEAGTRTGGSDKQLQAVPRWLRSHGLAIQRADAGRFSVKFSGTVAQVEEAFRVEIHDYLVDGKAYYANSNHPSIPRALSGLVAGVNSLDDFPASGNTHGETVLHHFTGTLYQPAAGGIMDSAGNLYGTTAGGGTTGLGTVFKLGTKGNETVLYNFTGANGDGANPNAGLVMDRAGNLYGTTSSGGADFAGTVFKLDTTGHETVLCSFTGANGAQPNTALITDTAGNLYGSTLSGGSDNGGTFFKLDTTGQETVLYSFPATNGDGADSRLFGRSGEEAGLIMDSAGNLYGTTVYGGASGAGTVFKLDTTGSETVLYSFRGLEKADGDYPQGGLIMDNAGNLYGTTFYGGMVGCPIVLYDKGCGTVFKIDPTGQETVLYSFTPANGDGENPAAGLVMDSGGNLYGTTSLGGLVGCQFDMSCGTVFKIDPTGHETVLYSFTGSYGDGAGPSSALIMDSAGNLYGTTEAGGLSGIGTVFELDTTGHETVLYSFDGTPGDAYLPVSGLIMDSAGNLYGTTYADGFDLPGMVYKLDTTGHETVLYSFTDGSDGGNPSAGLIMDNAGNLYGTTVNGGASDVGTVFELNTTGHETVLYSFTGGSDGANPYAGLIMDNAGNLYGTTVYGGSADVGVVFELSPPRFTVGGASVSISPGATSGNTSTITITPIGGFTGNVKLTATITSSPTGAQDIPTLSFGSTTPVSITSTTAGTATLTISTTAATSGALTYPVRPGFRWYANGSGALAFALVFGMCVPMRRRGWRARFGLLVVLVALTGGLLACGSGSGGGGGGNPGTTAGTYTVTVTGTSGNTTATGTVTLTVQ